MKTENEIMIAPSLLAADFNFLLYEMKRIENRADFIHIDVMDGHYVPNLSFGIPIIESLRPKTDILFDVHLMISNPDQYIKRYAEAGADFITFHIETTDKPLALIEEIHSVGKKAGISIHPDTPIEKIYPYLKDVDLILIMSVRPGFGGQTFMPESLERIQKIKTQLDSLSAQTLLSVDGGINLETGKQVINAGANMLVAGNFVFKDSDPGAVIRRLKECTK